MAGTLVEIKARFPYRSGLPRDVAINTFHFWAADGTDLSTYGPLLADEVGFFYTVPGAAEAVTHYMSRVINFTTSTIEAYTVADWETSSPTWTPVHSQFLTAPDSGLGDDSLPLEVACCLSFKGVARVSGSGDISSAARRRGRVFIGPLDQRAVGDVTVVERPVPSDVFMGDLVTCASALKAAVAGDGGQGWVIWSRAAHSLVAVSDGWVDNEWDTQRRRGMDATVRLPFA